MPLSDENLAAVDPLIGRTIVGSYTIRSKLAEGGMGAVYIAENDLQKKKVVKFLLAEFNRHPDIRARFDREARAAARLTGKPHIVEIDDVGSLPDGRQFMTMEYLRGRSLEGYLREHGRLAPHNAFYIFVQIARGLYELHTGGIIHRDLKPGNIFLVSSQDYAYYVKLIDLGIAHDAMTETAGLHTQTGAAMGTPGYMAPEQFDNAGSVTSSADLYSLAIVLWEMLCGPGMLPWGIPDLRVLYHKQKTQIPAFPADIPVPRGWIATLLAALSPQVELRPRSTYAFLAALASELQPDAEHGVPSGAAMMATFAGPLMKNAPLEDGTVRAPEASAIAQLSWSPPRATVVPEPAGYPTPQHASTPITSNEPPRAAAPTPPVVARTPHLTTLGVSNGVAVPSAPPKPRWGLAVGLAAVLAIAGVVVGVAFRGADHAGSPAAQPGDRGSSVPQVLDAAVPVHVPPPVDAARPPVDAARPIDAPPPIDAAHVTHPTPVPANHATKPRTLGGKRGSAAFDPDAVED